MTATRIYRLDVEYPEGVDWRNPPDGWEPDLIYDSDGTPEETTFYWPRARHFLSKRAAVNRAERLRSWGCTVDVVASLPVQWPTAAS